MAVYIAADTAYDCTYKNREGLVSTSLENLIAVVLLPKLNSSIKLDVINVKIIDAIYLLLF